MTVTREERFQRMTVFMEPALTLEYFAYGTHETNWEAAITRIVRRNQSSILESLQNKRPCRKLTPNVRSSQQGSLSVICELRIPTEICGNPAPTLHVVEVW